MTAYDNVNALIEKFGGLRPMAKALNVPVPTVQGWKKRGRVPPEHHMALAAQLAKLATTQVDTPPKPEPIIVPQKTTPIMAAAKPKPSEQLLAQQAAIQKLLATPHQSSSYWVWLGLASVAGIIATFLILVLLFFAPNLRTWLWPQPSNVAAAPTPTQQWLARLDTLEEQLQALNEHDAARAQALETLQKTRMQLTAHSPEANQGIKDLQAQMAALQTQLKQLNAQKQDNSLLQKLAAQDSRAATLLLVATKLQQILQNQAPFEAELPKLKALLADFPALLAGLEKLAPFANKGLPTTPRIQADIQRRAMDYQVAQQQAASQNKDQPSWLAHMQTITQRFVTVKKDDQLLLGQAPNLPPAVPEALDNLQQNNYAASLKNLRALPADWQQALAPSMAALESRVAAQNLLNQIWRASTKLVRGQKE